MRGNGVHVWPLTGEERIVMTTKIVIDGYFKFLEISCKNYISYYMDHIVCILVVE